MIKLPKSSIRKPGRRSAIVAILTAASLSGCGGGGGSSAGGSSLAPAATSTAVQTSEDIPVSGALIASDPDGDPLVFSIVNQSTLGTASITDATTGIFTYNPNANSTGTDNFSFKVNDGSADSNIATVTVTILATDDAPVAEDADLTTTEDTPVANTLVATDAEQQPLAYTIVSNGTLGTATITDAATGAFDYTPDPDANGSDTFTFKASDGLMSSNVATVSINITPVNDPPIATGNCSTTPQAQTLSGRLRATDDPELPSLLMYSLADGSTGPFITANGGEVTISDPTTGDFTYTPGTGSNGSRGRDTFTYRVTDPDGEIDSATETVIVDQAVMPLGDSITAGRISDAVGPPEPLRAGYRKPLQDTLTASGATFDFVGSVDHGWDLPDFDYNHEGHGGWPPADIAWGQNGGYPTDGVRAWLDSNPADIVLLHIGTIGVDRSYDIDVEAILDEIDEWEASASGNPVTVILALIIDRATIEPEVTAYNNNLRTLADNRIASGDDIIVVDQHSALTYPDDIEDNTHPTAVGYSKMSPVWFNALTDVVDKCP